MDCKVQIQIVTWNSKTYLNSLFNGIKRQKNVNFKVVVIDNASEGGTVQWMRQNFPDARIIQNFENKGFAKAHNQGFQICQAPYVLVLNPDAELMENFLQKTVQAIESDNRIASVGGMLYKKLPNDFEEGVIDSMGLKLKLYGKIADIGQNKRIKANFSPKMDVFGISGACVLYRLSALKKIKDEHGVFDERFGSYKEDADLAWRLKRKGFLAKIEPGSIARHARAVGKGERAFRPREIKYLSLRNHLLMLKKNLSWHDRHRFIFIAGYELSKFIYVLLFERKNLKAYKELWTYR